jgi:hypothetical protein
MEAAIKDNDFEEAAKCRDQLRRVKLFLPEYQLSGMWKGSLPEQGGVLIRLRYDGDELIAEKLDGEMTFRADVSESTDKGKTLSDVAEVTDAMGRAIYKDVPPEFKTHFKGQGKSARGFVDGQLYCISDDTIGFLFLGNNRGGDTRVLATAGGISERREGNPLGDGDEDPGETLIVFKRIDDDNTPLNGPPSASGDMASFAAKLNELFKLGGPDRGLYGD